jgi:hypothetical protein
MVILRRVVQCTRRAHQGGLNDSPVFEIETRLASERDHGPGGAGVPFSFDASNAFDTHPLRGLAITHDVP